MSTTLDGRSNNARARADARETGRARRFEPARRARAPTRASTERLGRPDSTSAVAARGLLEPPRPTMDFGVDPSAEQFARLQRQSNEKGPSPTRSPP